MERDVVDTAGIELGVYVKPLPDEGESLEEFAAADGWFGMDGFPVVIEDEESATDADTDTEEDGITSVEVDVDEGVVFPNEMARVPDIAGAELDTETGNVADGTVDAELV
ncbi:hypothetical protein AnigIFM63309_008629 [Aspergillus niger]|nr:hypothetical protein AnigIFM63309_008629 [Aspergillus niger]